MNTLVQELVSKLPPDDIYPRGVISPIRPRIRGRSFFPGGSGLFNGISQPLAPRPIMLVGQDFGTLAYWNEVDERGETQQGTWSGLLRMLDRARINPCDCFFTNALLGVRVEGPIDGPSPGLAFPEYVDACIAFLVDQIRLVGPSVVVALGKVPTILLARRLGLASSLDRPCDSDSRNPTWPMIDAAVEPFVQSVGMFNKVPMCFATSVHPDRYWLNHRLRSWPSRGTRGEAAHDLIWATIANSRKS